MIVYNSEVVTLLVSDMKFPLSTEQGLNRIEHTVLKRIKTIINKFRNCIFLQKSEGAMAPPVPVVGGPVAKNCQKWVVFSNSNNNI